MRKLSTGQDSTLGNYRIMAVAVFGQDSKAVAFLDKKIAESPNGVDEEVIVEESQAVSMLGQLHIEGLRG
ncbi:hypothetical protein ACET9R_18835 [Aeromonas veronii]|uniref:hypothetical protein n=1 Tax=Aeromonas TaxID=642 RepID=UPI002E7BC4F1|nr:hypothetical protein [Aeromonas caviae]MEE1914659.1 hypothetical protein [Aeromonas caviae]